MTRRFVLAGRVCVFLLAVAALASSLALNALPVPNTADSAGKHDAAASNSPATASNSPVFLIAPSISVAGRPAAIVAGDLNGDGAPDLVVANAQTGNVDVLLGDGKGKFLAPVHYKVGGSPVALVLGDLAGHGKIDIAVASQSGNSVSVLLGKGDGTFQAAVTYAVGASPSALAIGDFDGDGHADLLVANTGSNTLAVLTNKGDGTFQSAKFYAVTASPLAIAVADFNGDGKLDIASGNADGTVNILLGDGTGRLNIAATMTAATRVSALVVGDFNADGKSDLAVADPVASTVSIFLGRGDGTFQSSSTVPVGNEPVFLALEDVNADGVPDLLAVNRSGNTVSVMLGAGNGSFQPSADYVVGNSPVAVAIADFNGDGHLDFATANSADGTVTVPLGNGDGTFQAAQDYRTHLERKSVTVGDLNGDGHPDVVVASLCGNDPKCAGNGTASVFLSNGKGALTPASVYTLGKGPISIALADVNGDKKLDLIAVNRDDGTVMVLLGNGDGTFQEGVTYPAGVSPISVSVGDFNKDGKPDLAIAALCGSAGCHQQGSVNILLGNGDGSFKSGASYDVGFSPASVAVGDVDGDGKLDLVVANSCGKSAACSNGTASVLLGDGKGNFTLKTEVDLGKQVSSVALADLNQDGKLDLIAANSADNQVGVLLGNGDGTFSSQVPYAVGVGPSGVVVADFDGDGLPDVAVANLKNSTVSLLHGNGDGTLKTAVAYPVGMGPDALAALDLTGSGKLAVVTANGNSGGSPVGNDITLLANAGAIPLLTSTTIDVTSVSPASETYGQDAQVTITAVLSWTGGGPAPTASNVTIGGNGPSTYGATSCGAPVGTTITCTATYTPTAADTVSSSPYTETATFTADINYSGSSSPQTNNFAIGKTTTTINVTNVSPASEVYGQDAAVTITAVLSWTGGGTAPTAGNVTISGNGPSTYGATSCGAPVGTTITCTATYTPTAADTVALSPYTEKATFTADSNYGAASSPQTNNFAIGKTTTTINVTNVNPASETYGQDAAVTITAVLSWTGGGTAPTAGNVTISGNGPSTYGATSCGAPVGDTMTCTATYTPTVADTVASSPYTETATFSGDSNYSNFASTQTKNFTISQATTTTAAATFIINQVTATTADVNQVVTFATTVVGQYGGTPTGMVAFMAVGKKYGSIVLCSGAPLASAAATCMPTTLLQADTYTVTATYGGDSNFIGSTSPQDQLIVNPTPTTTAIPITLTQNYCTGAAGTSPGIVICVQNNTLTITLTGQATPTIAAPQGYTGYVPTGTITFVDTSTNQAVCANPASVSTVNGIQQATCSVTDALAIGTHPISAEYNGDPNFSTSTSATTPVTVPSPSTISSPILSGESGAISLTTPASLGAATTVAFSCNAIAGTAPAVPGGLVGPNPAGYFTDANGTPATPYVTCDFSETSVTGPGATTTITVCTVLPQSTSCQSQGTPAVVERAESRLRWNPFGLGLALPALAFVGIGTFIVGGGRARPEKRGLFRALGLLLGMSLLCLLLACGGGGAFSGTVEPPQSASGQTPVGSYTLTIAGSGSDGSVEIYNVQFSVTAH